MNKFLTIGNLTKDVELRQTQGGKSVATFTVAVQREIKVDGQPEADFFPVVVWGVLGENCAKYLSKGKKVGIVGRLQNRSYKDNKGNKRQITEVVASEVDFNITPKGNEAENGLKMAHDINNGQFEAVEDEDIPF